MTARSSRLPGRARAPERWAKSIFVMNFRENFEKFSKKFQEISLSLVMNMTAPSHHEETDPQTTRAPLTTMSPSATTPPPAMPHNKGHLKVATSNFLRSARPAKAAIAKVFAKICRTNQILQIFRTRKTLGDVENYALSKFQP